MSRAARARAAVVASLLFVLVAAPSAQARAPHCPRAVAAPSTIVIEVSTGTVACARAADRRRPVASLTKLMTALLTLEHGRLGATLTASSYRPAPIESQLGLLPGERMRVRDLLRGLLVESANDAAATLAEGVARSRRAFVRRMNARARALGLRNTHFANPIGLDQEGNYSSARDLALLTLVLRTNAFFKRVVDLPSVTLRSGVRARTFLNRNDLVRRFGWVNGVKTGHTQGAGYALVASGRRHGVQVVSVVLGTPSEAARDADSLALMRFALARFRAVRSVVAGRALATPRIRAGGGTRLRLLATRTIRRVVPAERPNAVTLDIRAPRTVAGPVRRGERVGRVEVRQGGRLVATVPLVAARRVTRPAPPAGGGSSGAAVLLVLLATAVVGGSVLRARRRRATTPGRPGKEPSAA